jgi:hypothetical protein
VRRLRVLAATAALAGCSAFLVRPAPTVTRGNFPACTEAFGAPAGDLAIATIAGLITYASVSDGGQIVVPAGVAVVYLASAIYGAYSIHVCRNAQLEALASISSVPFHAPAILLPRDAGAVAAKEGGAGD